MSKKPTASADDTAASEDQAQRTSRLAQLAASTAAAQRQTADAEAVAKALAADSAAKAAAAHQAVVAELTALHDGVGSKLAELKAHLLKSLGKATEDPEHAAHTASFLRDVDLKADELITWIKRSL